VVWDEATAPYQTIAVIGFPSQDALIAERNTFWEDRMKLSPWDALPDHQPLGSINRLRKIVYDMSRKKREAVNATATKPIDSIDEIPRTLGSPLISNEVSNRTIKIEDQPLEDYFQSASTNTYFYKARATTCV
jgi:hypothetical protein